MIVDGMNEYLEDFTLIVFSYNRPRHLERLFEYYKNSRVKMIVVDGSEQCYNIGVPDNVEYVHMAGSLAVERINYACSLVHTNYVALSPDDDFYVIENLAESIKILKEDSFLSAVNGLTMLFSETETCEAVRWHICYANDWNYELKSLSEANRVFQFMSRYQQLFYAVTRIHVLRTTATKLLAIPELVGKEGRPVGNIIELLWGIYSVLSGGVHRLQKLLFVREHDIDRAVRNLDNKYYSLRFDEYEMHGLSYLTDIAKKFLKNELMENDCIELNEVDFNDFVNECFSNYISQQNEPKHFLIPHYPHVYSSVWKNGKLSWAFEKKQYLEHPIYNQVTFSHVQNIDTLVRKYAILCGSPKT